MKASATRAYVSFYALLPERKLKEGRSYLNNKQSVWGRLVPGRQAFTKLVDCLALTVAKHHELEAMIKASQVADRGIHS